jgi:hypothetical protein
MQQQHFQTEEITFEEIFNCDWEPFAQQDLSSEVFTKSKLKYQPSNPEPTSPEIQRHPQPIWHGAKKTNG